MVRMDQRQEAMLTLTAQDHCLSLSNAYLQLILDDDVVFLGTSDISIQTRAAT